MRELERVSKSTIASETNETERLSAGWCESVYQYFVKFVQSVVFHFLATQVIAATMGSHSMRYVGCTSGKGDTMETILMANKTQDEFVLPSMGKNAWTTSFWQLWLFDAHLMLLLHGADDNDIVNHNNGTTKSHSLPTKIDCTSDNHTHQWDENSIYDTFLKLSTAVFRCATAYSRIVNYFFLAAREKYLFATPNLEHRKSKEKKTMHIFHLLSFSATIYEKFIYFFLFNASVCSCLNKQYVYEWKWALTFRCTCISLLMF